MKTTLLLLLSLTCLTFARGRALVKVAPDRTQFFEYEQIAVTCESMDSDEWTAWRYTTHSLQLSQCGSGWGTQTSSTCVIDTVKLSTSGVYWCESKYRDSSSAINITVTDRPVILVSPVLPVTQGSDVMLLCKTKAPPTNRLATFYKDDNLVGIGESGHMTIYNVSMSDEGAYRCKVSGVGESLISWLLIKADDSDDSLSLTTFPESLQLREYENLSLTCGCSGGNGSLRAWSIKRFTTLTSTLSSCGGEWGTVTSSGCTVETIKPPDSAVYWCESLSLQRSSSVNITVYDKPVILRGPVQPPTVGDNVTLRCETMPANFNQPATFFKDGYLIRTEPTGHMTLYHVSKFNEGVYTCLIIGTGESPPTLLLVRGDSVSSAATLSVFAMIRYVMVSLPYFISTLLMVFRYCDIRQKPRPQIAEKSQSVSMTTAPPTEDDEGAYEAANITTEHHF